MKNKKIVIGVVGKTGAGKDTFCDYLKKYSKLPVFIFRFSDPLTQVLKIFFDKIKKEDQQWLGKVLRERYGNDILAKTLKKEIEKIKKGLVVLNGVRYQEEFEMIKKIGGKIVYIDCPEKLRWKRLQKRGEKLDDKVSFKKFLEMERAKTESQIEKISKFADFVIKNDSTKKDFAKKVLNFCKNLINVF
jgi:dephospho-CoA kinase